MLGVDAEMEGLRTFVSRHFPVTQIVVNPFAITFHVTPDPNRLNESFDALRQDLVPQNYIPSIVYEGGAYLIHVQKRQEAKFRGVHVNLLLLIATVGTTWVAGAVNWGLYADVSFTSLEAFVFGFLSFTVPLLAILGAHEMGHYVMAKRHGVRASLPFFIPSVPILGTFGAFISMRDPIPNRKALLEIGIAGPLVGFAIAIPISIIGLFLSAADTRPPMIGGGGEMTMGSLLYGFLQGFFPESLLDPFRRHPTAFAGWVGFFVTAINLLPAGQLDGGHVARAVFGERARYFSWGAVFLLLALGVTYTGWFLFALIILLLGVRHPPPLNDITKLRPSRRALGVLAFLILILTFVPQPFVEVPSTSSFSFQEATPPHDAITALAETIPSGTSRIIEVNLNNTGNVFVRVLLAIDTQNLENFGWTIRIQNYTLFRGGTAMDVQVSDQTTTIGLNATEYATLRIFVNVPTTLTRTYRFELTGQIVNTDRINSVIVSVTVP